MPRIDRADAFAQDEARRQAERNKPQRFVGANESTQRGLGYCLNLLRADWWPMQKALVDWLNSEQGVRSIPPNPFQGNAMKVPADKMNSVAQEIERCAGHDRQANRGVLSQTAQDVLGAASHQPRRWHSEPWMPPARSVRFAVLSISTGPRC